MNVHFLFVSLVAVETIHRYGHSIRPVKPGRQEICNENRQPRLPGTHFRKCLPSRSIALSRVASCLQKQNRAKCRGARTGSS